MNYTCSTTNTNINLDKGATICPYTGTNTSSIKKDDRGLRKNVATTLTGTVGRTCLPNGSSATVATIANPSNQYIYCANSDSPDEKQDLKCQFYCPNGWHKEGGGTAQQKCVENSCGAQSSTMTGTSNRSTTYAVPCLDHNKSATLTTTVAISHGRVVYTNTFSCSLGDLSAKNSTCSLSSTTCDAYYHADSSCSCPANTCSTTSISNATMCEGDNDAGTVPTHNLTSTVVSSCTSTKKCEFTCNSGYTRYSNECYQNCSATTKNGYDVPATN